MERDFPDWNNLYNTQNVKTMPWYNENLDSDLEEELERGKISKGRILDLGTGPATQAIQIVTGYAYTIWRNIMNSCCVRIFDIFINISSSPQ